MLLGGSEVVPSISSEMGMFVDAVDFKEVDSAERDVKNCVSLIASKRLYDLQLKGCSLGYKDVAYLSFP